MVLPLQYVYGATVVCAAAVVAAPIFVITEFNDKRTYIMQHTECITSETYGPPFMSFGRIIGHVVYAMIGIANQLCNSTHTSSKTRAYLSVSTLLSAALIIFAWGRSAAANQQSLPALASVRVSFIHVVGVIGLIFNPTCLALGLTTTIRKNQ
jgi:hypothetical protein